MSQSVEDLYIQMSVRLENLKEGEAREIVKTLAAVQQDILAKLESVSGDWSRERLTSMTKTMDEMLDAVYTDQILPKLKQDGLVFTAKNQAYQYEALTQAVTGQAVTDRIAAAAELGFRTSIPVYRGSTLDESIAGRFFTRDATYASRYAGMSFDEYVDFTDITKGGGNVGKFFLPNDGWVDLSVPAEKARFNTWLREVKFAPDQVVGEVWDTASGKPNWLARPLVEEYLNEKFPGWTVTMLDEDDAISKASRISYLTREEGMAKSVYSDFAAGAPETQNFGSAVVATNVSPAALYAAATAKPFEGKIMKEWATQLSRKQKTLLSAALRNSWLEGESVQKSAQGLQAIMAQSRRDAATLTRTYYSHLAAATRDSVWNENSDLVEGITWDSILDGRTTVDICAPRDQLAYTLAGEPIDHNLPFMNGPGLAHWNCRSIGIPRIKGVERRARRQAVGAGSNYERGDNVTRTGRVRVNSKRNRDSGILKETTVAPGTNFEQWLRTQPLAFQQDYLGVAKADAFRKGTWSLGETFSAENPYTLKQY